MIHELREMSGVSEQAVHLVLIVLFKSSDMLSFLVLTRARLAFNLS